MHDDEMCEMTALSTPRFNCQKSLKSTQNDLVKDTVSIAMFQVDQEFISMN